MKSVWIFIGSIVLAGLLVAGQYNGLVSRQEAVTQAWAQVENVLQRRADLIPNLVETVKGYVKHEKETMAAVVEARAKLGGARSVSEKIQAHQELGSALSRLLVVVENYPQLRANENFARLQDELAGAENRIAVERMRYNQALQTYNVFVKRFPTNLIAGLLGFRPNDAYFQAAEAAKTVPPVNF